MHLDCGARYREGLLYFRLPRSFSIVAGVAHVFFGTPGEAIEVCGSTAHDQEAQLMVMTGTGASDYDLHKINIPVAESEPDRGRGAVPRPATHAI